MSSGKQSTLLRQKCRFGLITGIFVLALSGCQSGNPLDLGLGGNKNEAPKDINEGKIDVATISSYCPNITLRSGTAFYNTYEKGGEQDASRIIYQASATDVTRDCQVSGDTLSLTVAMGGRVTPGPKGTPGTITMPVRVAVVDAGQVVFSELYQHQAQIGASATPFVFRADGINVPKPAGRTMQIFIGYDEGPYDTQ